MITHERGALRSRGVLFAVTTVTKAIVFSASRIGVIGVFGKVLRAKFIFLKNSDINQYIKNILN
jgi:hypothetical protein